MPRRDERGGELFANETAGGAVTPGKLNAVTSFHFGLTKFIVGRCRVHGCALLNNLRFTRRDSQGIALAFANLVGEFFALAHACRQVENGEEQGS